jgi:hypothetical protein
MKNLFPYRPDIVKLGNAIRRFSMTFGLTGVLFDYAEDRPMIFWGSIILLGIGGIGEALSFLYNKDESN